MCGQNGTKHSLTRLHHSTKMSLNITRTHHLSMAENMSTKEKLCPTQKALSGRNKLFGVCITSLFVVSAV